MIREFRFSGPLGAADEFIELFNAGPSDVNMAAWMLRSTNNVVPPTIAI